MTHFADELLQELPAIVGLDPTGVTRWSIDPSETQRTAQFHVVPSPAASSLAALDGSTVRRQMNRALLSERAGKGLLIPRKNSFAESGVHSSDVKDAESSSDVLPEEGSGADPYFAAADADPSNTDATHQNLPAILHGDAASLLATMPEDRPTARSFQDAEWVGSGDLLPSSPSEVSFGHIPVFSSDSLSSLNVDSSELLPDWSEPVFVLAPLSDTGLAEVDDGVEPADDDAVRSDELYAFEIDACTANVPSLVARELLTADIPFPRSREDFTMDLPFGRTMESATASSSRVPVVTSASTSVRTPSQRNLSPASSSKIQLSRPSSSSRMPVSPSTRSTSSVPRMGAASDEQWMALMPPPVFVEHAVTDLDRMLKDSSGPQSAYPTSPIIRTTPFHRSRFVSPGVVWGIMGIGLGVVLGALWVGARLGETTPGSISPPSVAGPVPVATVTTSEIRPSIAAAAAPLPVKVVTVIVPPIMMDAPSVQPAAQAASAVVPVGPTTFAGVAPVAPSVSAIATSPFVSAPAPSTYGSSPAVQPSGEFSVDSLPLEPEPVAATRNHKR